METEQAKTELPPEVFFWGCDTGFAGHGFSSKSSKKPSWHDTPFKKIDGGLLRDDTGASLPTGRWVEAYKDGWTAVSFWDNSGYDKRPGCNSGFVVKAHMLGVKLLEIARQQWPEVFARPSFPKLEPEPFITLHQGVRF